MDSRSDRVPRLAAPLATALTALGWWFGTSLQPLWWAASLAPLLLLAIAQRVRASAAMLATFVAFPVGGANMWHYAHDVVRLPLTVTLAAILAPAVLMMPVTLLFRALALRGRLLAATFALTLATNGLSWIGATLSPHGTYGHLAYSQMDALPVIQIAGIAGFMGRGLPRLGCRRRCSRPSQRRARIGAVVCWRWRPARLCSRSRWAMAHGGCTTTKRQPRLVWDW